MNIVAIRDSQGEVLAAMLEKFPLPSSVVMVEFLVARRAVEFAQNIGIYHSIFLR